jgi:three-Cys-motif partner protein
MTFMMSKKDVKKNLLHHSEAKVQLLGEYLKRYLNIISNDGYTEKINFYDLFCGQGEYEDGGEGSPLVTLRKIKETYFSKIAKTYNKKPKIDCQFNDIDSSKIDILKKAISNKSLHYPNIGNLKLTSIDYQLEVKRLAKTFRLFKNEKGFVFIDPYGYKDVKAEHIKQLINYNNSEVLLWLPIQFMYRFSKNETPESLQNFIEELSLCDEIEKTNNVWEFISILKNGFQSYLGDNYFVDNFSLKKEENTVFCLYFFTSHIKGFEKMLEAKWEIDAEQGRGWEYTGNVPSLFFEHKTNEFEEKLKLFISEGKRYNYEIYEFTLRQGYLPKHTNEILDNLQRNMELVVLLNNGEKARKKSFYIKYYRPNDIDKRKVYFVIK